MLDLLAEVPEDTASETWDLECRRRLFAWACWAVAAFGIVVSVLSGGVAALAGPPPLLFVAYLGWLLFWLMPPSATIWAIAGR